MNIKKLMLGSADFPEVLRHIYDPPKALYHSGADLAALLEKPRITIVGSRRPTAYGQQVTGQLARELAQRGIVVVSGLALGIDGLAHRAALEAGGLAIAVLPGPLDRVVPAANRQLARQIISQGGALVSEYGPGEQAYKHNFIARNRLMAGFGQAVLITEAAENSGSLHTANFALDGGKEVLAVPGNITSSRSAGTNNLIKAGKAHPITSYVDVLHYLGLKEAAIVRRIMGRNAREQSILDLMSEGITEGEALLRRSRLSTSQFNQALTMLEIGGLIRPLGANHWSIV